MWYDLLEKHMGKVFGVLLGLIFGLLVLKYGLIKALFVSICVCAGFYLGKRMDEKIDFRGIFARYFQR